MALHSDDYLHRMFSFWCIKEMCMFPNTKNDWIYDVLECIEEIGLLLENLITWTSVDRPLLLTWIYINPSMQWSVGEITYPFLNLQCTTIEVWGWLSNSIPHFIVDVIIHPCWN